ncbi:winged helix-turn-helix domain-containing protein [Erwinia amylovora]
MSRKIIINNVVSFEPEKKNISGAKGTFTVSTSATLCFELLIENVGNLVTHDQFYEYAWRRFGMEPTSTSLYQNISTLRKSLSNAGMTQDIIRTMPRRGFLLSPLTEINRSGPERIINENDDEKNTHVNLNENSKLKNEKESIETHSSGHILPLDRKNRVLSRRHNKMSWLLASASGIAIGIFSYCIKINIRDEPVFSSKSVLYKECTIFTNRDSDLQSDEMFRLVDSLNLKCENNRYAYITSYRFSDRISLLLCRNPLGDNEAPECHSVYYIKNMLK